MKPARRRPQSGKAQIKKIMKNIILAMPLAQATPGSLTLGCLRRKNPAYPYRIFFVLGVSLVFVFWFLLGDIFLWVFFNWTIFWWNYFMGDAFGPGYCGLAYAWFLLRKEPSPAYPYRFFDWVYLIMLLGDVLSWSCVFNLGDAFQARSNRSRFVRFLLRKEPSPSYPYHIFITCCITSALAGRRGAAFF